MTATSQVIKATKAKAPHGDQTKGASKTTVSAGIVQQKKQAIKGLLLTGQPVRVIDYRINERSIVLAAIAELRDELPIICGWHTVRESHASQTRTRARTYTIPAALLQGDL